MGLAGGFALTMADDRTVPRVVPTGTPGEEDLLRRLNEAERYHRQLTDLLVGLERRIEDLRCDIYRARIGAAMMGERLEP